MSRPGKTETEASSLSSPDGRSFLERKEPKELYGKGSLREGAFRVYLPSKNRLPSVAKLEKLYRTITASMLFSST